MRFEENFRKLHSRQQRWDERGIPMPRLVISTEAEKSPCTMVPVISGKYVFWHTASLSTKVCLNVSNYLKSQISKTSPFGTAYHLSPRESVSHDSQVASAPLRIVFACHPASGGKIYRGSPQISNLLSQICHFNSIKNEVKFFNSTR